MDNNDLKKLNRKQLLELLLKQAVHVEELENKIAELEQKLNDKQLTQQEFGSIAEAALKVNGVFEAAEAASEQYLENICNLSERQEEICRRIEWECREKARRRLEEVERKCMQMEAETIERCAKMQAAAKAEAPGAWRYSYGARA